MARTVKEKEYIARKNEIIDTAQWLIYSRGCDNLSISDILREMDISKGAFYHYFESRQALVDAVVNRMEEESEKAIRTIVTNPKLKTLDKLQAFLDLSDIMRTHGYPKAVRLMRMWYRDENTIIRQKVDEASIRQRSPCFDVILEQGIREGIFILKNAEYAGEMVTYLLQGLSNHQAKLLMFVEEEKKIIHLVDDILRVHDSYTGAIERLLGLPGNSLKRMDAKLAKTWVTVMLEAG